MNSIKLRKYILRPFPFCGFLVLGFSGLFRAPNHNQPYCHRLFREIQITAQDLVLIQQSGCRNIDKP